MTESLASWEEDIIVCPNTFLIKSITFRVFLCDQTFDHRHAYSTRLLIMVAYLHRKRMSEFLYCLFAMCFKSRKVPQCLTKNHCMLQSYTRQKMCTWKTWSVQYLLVRWDGHSEHFDGMLSCLIGSLLDPTTWLLVAGHRMAISDHHYVLILMIMGAPADRCMSLFSHMAIRKNHILKCRFK